jgi:hypothetical protein
VEVVVKWEHYPPSGYAKITLIGLSWCRVFQFKVRGPEKEVERAARNVIRRIRKLDLGAHIENYVIHCIDQIIAVQREWQNDTTGTT